MQTTLIMTCHIISKAEVLRKKNKGKKDDTVTFKIQTLKFAKWRWIRYDSRLQQQYGQGYAIEMARIFKHKNKALDTI